MKHNNNMRNFGELVGKIMVATIAVILFLALIWVNYTENNAIPVSGTIGIFAAVAIVLALILMLSSFITERIKRNKARTVYAKKAYAKYDFLHEYEKAEQMLRRISALESDLEGLMSFKQGVRKYILI